jgi:predicted dinucleotide-binding enzyme
MKIGFIGAGQIGGTLTRRFRTLGHEVFVANSRGPETLSDLAAETGATAVSVPEAVRGVPVAGDDKAARAVVLKLVDELGFDAIDAGGLDESWRQQPGTPVYATDLDAEGLRRALSEAKKERTSEWRGTENSPGTFTAPA